MEPAALGQAARVWDFRMNAFLRIELTTTMSNYSTVIPVITAMSLLLFLGCAENGTTYQHTYSYGHLDFIGRESNGGIVFTSLRWGPPAHAQQDHIIIGELELPLKTLSQDQLRSYGATESSNDSRTLLFETPFREDPFYRMSFTFEGESLQSAGFQASRFVLSGHSLPEGKTLLLLTGAGKRIPLPITQHKLLKLLGPPDQTDQRRLYP
ncbi:hypothetical protein ACERK3_17085 [Phycisphaerales bacterium AB-hyl4]|uniref:Uncharacterized protein n=1 Tax=Natronomicrosphaera hydrolytica TaxID=3242702 RepID=A0ABV4UB09_9BACT